MKKKIIRHLYGNTHRLSGSRSDSYRVCVRCGYINNKTGFQKRYPKAEQDCIDKE